MRQKVTHWVRGWYFRGGCFDDSMVEAAPACHGSLTLHGTLPAVGLSLLLLLPSVNMQEDRQHHFNYPFTSFCIRFMADSLNFRLGISHQSAPFSRFWEILAPAYCSIFGTNFFAFGQIFQLTFLPSVLESAEYCRADSISITFFKRNRQQSISEWFVECYAEFQSKINSVVESFNHQRFTVP